MVSVEVLDSDLSVNLDQIVYRDNLSVNEIYTLISQCNGIFALNPKKPRIVTNMQPQIITDEE